MRLIRRGPEVDPPLQGINKLVGLVGLVLLFIGYWIFIHQLERVDIRQSTWPIVHTLVAFLDFLPFTSVSIFVTELFTWRVLRHLFPPIIGFFLARKAILGMLQSFYDLEDEAAATILLHRLSATRIGFVKPTLVSLDTFEDSRQKDPLLKIGGPGRIFVFGGAALVTELDGRFHRVLGPGRHTLERFEFARTLVDLRPQERESNYVDLLTSEGIELSTTLSVTFQIDPGNEEPSKTKPFPFTPEAVRKAAYTETNMPDGSTGIWDSLPMLITAGQLRAIVAEYPLDELILSESNGINVHRRLQEEMERRAKNIMRSYGVIIRGTRLGALNLDKEVVEQRTKYWEAGWDVRQTLQMTEGEVTILEDWENARAEAEAVMLQGIAEGLQRSRRAGRDVTSRVVVALRLIESLEAMAKKSEQVIPLPEQLIPHLDTLRQQLMLTSGTLEETRPKNQE